MEVSDCARTSFSNNSVSIIQKCSKVGDDLFPITRWAWDRVPGRRLQRRDRVEPQCADRHRLRARHMPCAMAGRAPLELDISDESKGGRRVGGLKVHKRLIGDLPRQDEKSLSSSSSSSFPVEPAPCRLLPLFASNVHEEDPHPGPLPQVGEGGRKEASRMPALLKTGRWKKKQDWGCQALCP